MKTAAFVLLATAILPFGANAQTKGKSSQASTSKMKTTGKAPVPPKSKVIDMSVPANTQTAGIISTELDGRAVQFFMSAFEIGALETWLGNQAKTRGEADKVRAVGDALQSTQMEENELLSNLAKKKGVVLAPTQGESAGQKQLVSQLAKLTGAEFDQAVMNQIATVTQQAVDSYTTATNAADPDIKHFAEQILPMVNEKLVLAKKVAGKAPPSGTKPGFRESVPALPPPAVETKNSSAPAPSPLPVVPATLAATPTAMAPKGKTTPAPVPKPTPIMSTPPNRPQPPTFPAAADATGKK